MRFLVALESLAADVRAIRVLLERETGKRRGRGRAPAADPMPAAPGLGGALAELLGSVVDGWRSGR